MEWLFGPRRTMREQLQDQCKVLRASVRALESAALRADADAANARQSAINAIYRQQIPEMQDAGRQHLRARMHARRFRALASQVKEVLTNITQHTETLNIQVAMARTTRILLRAGQIMPTEQFSKMLANYQLSVEKLTSQQNMVNEVVADVADADAESMAEESTLFEEGEYSEALESFLVELGAPPAALPSRPAASPSSTSDLEAQLPNLNDLLHTDSPLTPAAHPGPSSSSSSLAKR